MVHSTAALAPTLHRDRNVDVWLYAERPKSVHDHEHPIETTKAHNAKQDVGVEPRWSHTL